MSKKHETRSGKIENDQVKEKRKERRKSEKRQSLDAEDVPKKIKRRRQKSMYTKVDTIEVKVSDTTSEEKSREKRHKKHRSATIDGVTKTIGDTKEKIKVKKKRKSDVPQSVKSRSYSPKPKLPECDVSEVLNLLKVEGENLVVDKPEIKPKPDLDLKAYFTTIQRAIDQKLDLFLHKSSKQAEKLTGQVEKKRLHRKTDVQLYYYCPDETCEPGRNVEEVKVLHKKKKHRKSKVESVVPEKDVTLALPDSSSAKDTSVPIKILKSEKEKKKKVEAPVEDISWLLATSVKPQKIEPKENDVDEAQENMALRVFQHQSVDSSTSPTRKKKKIKRVVMYRTVSVMAVLPPTEEEELIDKKMNTSLFKNYYKYCDEREPSLIRSERSFAFSDSNRCYDDFEEPLMVDNESNTSNICQEIVPDQHINNLVQEIVGEVFIVDKECKHQYKETSRVFTNTRNETKKYNIKYEFNTAQDTNAFKFFKNPAFSEMSDSVTENNTLSKEILSLDYETCSRKPSKIVLQEQESPKKSKKHKSRDIKNMKSPRKTVVLPSIFSHNIVTRSKSAIDITKPKPLQTIYSKSDIALTATKKSHTPDRQIVNLSFKPPPTKSKIPELKSSYRRNRIKAEKKHTEMEKTPTLIRSKSELNPRVTENVETTNKKKSKDRLTSGSLDRCLTKTNSRTSLFLTKEYKKGQMSAFEKRKTYDETIRRKLLKKTGKQRTMSQQIFEVRFMTVSNNLKSSKKKKTKDVVMKSDSNSCSVLICCCNSKVKCTCDAKDSKVEAKPKLKSKTSFPVKSNTKKTPIKVRISHKKADDPVKVPTIPKEVEKTVIATNTSVCAIDTTTSTRPMTQDSIVNTEPTNFMTQLTDLLDTKKDSVEEVKQVIHDLFPSLAPTELKTDKSCPALNNTSPSFDFLYENSSSQFSNESITVPKICQVVNVSQMEPFGSIISEESGYTSARSKKCSSVTNFFKKPNIKALFKPISVDKLTNPCISETNYEKMSKECQLYARKVAHSHEETTMNFQEIPLGVLLGSNSINYIKEERPDFCCLHTKLSNDKIKCSFVTKRGFVPKRRKRLKPRKLKKKVEEISISTNTDLMDVSSVKSESMVSENISLVTESTIKAMTYLNSTKNQMCHNFFKNLYAIYEKEFKLRETLLTDCVYYETCLRPLEVTALKQTGRIKQNIFKLFKRRSKLVKNSVNLSESSAIIVEEDASGLLDIKEESTVDIKSIARDVRKRFSSVAQAMVQHEDLDREIKYTRFLKILECVEKGVHAVIKKDDGGLMDNIKQEIKRNYQLVYEMVLVEAHNHGRSLAQADKDLVKFFVVKYCTGLFNPDVISTFIGRGVINSEDKLKAAVKYLLKMDKQVTIEEFDKWCNKFFIKSIK